MNSNRTNYGIAYNGFNFILSMSYLVKQQAIDNFSERVQGSRGFELLHFIYIKGIHKNFKIALFSFTSINKIHVYSTNGKTQNTRSD